MSTPNEPDYSTIRKEMYSVVQRILEDMLNDDAAGKSAKDAVHLAAMRVEALRAWFLQQLRGE